MPTPKRKALQTRKQNQTPKSSNRPKLYLFTLKPESFVCAMGSGFSPEFYGSSFNYDAYSRRLQAMLPVMSPSPSQSAVFAQLNRISMLSTLSRQVKMMLYSLLTDLDENEMSGQTIANPDDGRISSFINSCDSRKISGLAVLKIKLPAAVMNDDRARKIAVEQAKCYGADDSTERIVLYKLNESYYWGGVHLFKYGKYWRIDILCSAYANSSPLGNLTKMVSPLSEFDKIGE
jgi:hypothetical protein